MNPSNRFIIISIITAFITTSCLNPFAPVEGDVGQRIWSDQGSIGGLLDNFALAYDYRDSLRYADCLDESFIFHYYDIVNGHFDRWFRETDLKATGRMFKAFDNIDLEWNLVPDYVDTFSQPDIDLDFIVRFNLTLGNEVPLMGYARFIARKGVDGRFRIISWRDDF
ncbi:MAG: hypothetical protein P9X24_14480 [Candidatus Hatepunaea meridiana]|nr:hypothetical protein [Candidatus Hatepunaea meridiana]